MAKKNLNWKFGNKKSLDEEIKEQIEMTSNLSKTETINTENILPQISQEDNAFFQIIQNQKTQIKNLENDSKTSKKWNIVNMILALISIILAIIAVA